MGPARGRDAGGDRLAFRDRGRDGGPPARVGPVPGRDPGPRGAGALSTPRSPTSRRGAWAEDLARTHLERAGLTLRARNVRSRYGELDLVMEERGVVVFVEVRYRARETMGTGAESVGRAKQRRLVRTADWYLRHEDGDPPCRFDVVSVAGPTHAPRITWIRDAFEAG